jgi:hypothetical protein
LNWNRNAFHVLFASGNGDPVKRPWLAQKAVAEVSKRGAGTELHSMTHVPPCEVPLWLNASDALLLTSAHEGSPTIVKEALACGVPVVSVRVGDVEERIGCLDGCRLAEPDASALAEKLLLVRERKNRLDARGQLRTDLGRKCRRSIEANLRIHGARGSFENRLPHRSGVRGSLASVDRRLIGRHFWISALEYAARLQGFDPDVWSGKARRFFCASFAPGAPVSTTTLLSGCAA